MKKMTSNEIIQAIFEEVERAEKKYPYWPEDAIHAAAVVNQEAGELAEACLAVRYKKGSIEHAAEEAVQTAAMAVRFLLGLDRYHSMKRDG